MNRREFIAGFGGAVAWPLAARAQQPPLPLIGFVSSAAADTCYVAAFRQGLTDSGYIEGHNLAVRTAPPHSSPAWSMRLARVRQWRHHQPMSRSADQRPLPTCPPERYH
jgi:hypothetical protein